MKTLIDDPMCRYAAILVLGACMEWDPKKKRWTFPTFVSPLIYKPELVMGKARAIAAAEIASEAEVVLVTGGPQTNPETGETASRAVEMARLITQFGVPPEKVIPMGKGGNTLKNAEDTAAYLEEHPALLKSNMIAVLSPKFQAERAKAMFEMFPYFKEHKIEVDWIIVDEVLEGKNPGYRRWAKALESNPKYATVLESEKQGLSDLRSGKYKPKQ